MKHELKWNWFKMLFFWLGLSIYFYCHPVRYYPEYKFFEDIMFAFWTMVCLILICVFNHSFNKERRDKFKWSVIWSEAIAIGAIIILIDIIFC